MRKPNLNRHPERSEAESNFFRLRSQTSLRSVCSSLRSEFDYAQDDADEKSAERSKAGSTNNQRTMYAEAYPGISPMANIFVRAAICERAPIALAHKCEPECLQSKHRVDNENGDPSGNLLHLTRLPTRKRWSNNSSPIHALKKI